jgi:hypothetical protein
MAGWDEHVRRAQARYLDGLARLPREPDARQRQLVRVANAAYAAGLAALMAGRGSEGREWLRRAAARYRESLAAAPPDSWGRPIAIMKAAALADGLAGAQADARRTLELQAGEAASAIGRYAGCLALLVLGRDRDALALATALQGDEGFPPAVAEALSGLAGGDAARYARGLEGTLESFETRSEHLEGVPVADTVLVLELLAEPRRLAVRPASPLLPV